MTERDFCYWLQGFIELNGVEALSKEQVKIIQEHLHLVLNKVTLTTLDTNTVLDIPKENPESQLSLQFSRKDLQEQVRDASKDSWLTPRAKRTKND